MKLQENHKEFAVRCYAKYMKTIDIVDAFMEKFQHDLPQPPPEPEPPNYEQEVTGIDYQFNRDEFIAKNMENVEKRYIKTYGDQAGKKLEEDSEKLIEEFGNDFEKDWEKVRQRKRNEQMDKYETEVNNYNRSLKNNLSNQLRRLNITHTQFPEKYRQLFNQTRSEFFQSHINEDLLNNKNIRHELEIIYGYVKNLIFQEKTPQEVLRHVDRAHNILKTIAAYNANNQQQNTEKETQNPHNPTNT